MSSRFDKYFIKIKKCKNASINDLINDHNSIKDKQKGEFPIIKGIFNIIKDDLKKITNAMGIKPE